ncbi:MAG TPA: hypothetical protein VK716_10520 [Terracidiphilus sp.]|jgi:hypothetical protein|nr:hypothetical protein [Terracidiphilus sp.]
MQTREFCVYNETQENFLSTRVTVIDSRSDPLKVLKVLVEGLAVGEDTALWLNPIKTLPAVPRLSPYDLVLLDRDGKVVHGMELVPSAQIPNFNGKAVSALILPIHTFSASQTHTGDHVVICPAEELQARPARFPDPPPASFARPVVPAAQLPAQATPVPLPLTPVPNSFVQVRAAELPKTASAPLVLEQPLAQQLPRELLPDAILPDAVDIDAPVAIADLSPQYPTLQTRQERASLQSALPKAARFTTPRAKSSILRFLLGLPRLRIRLSVSMRATPAPGRNRVRSMEGGSTSTPQSGRLPYLGKQAQGRS